MSEKISGLAAKMNHRLSLLEASTAPSKQPSTRTRIPPLSVYLEAQAEVMSALRASRPLEPAQSEVVAAENLHSVLSDREDVSKKHTYPCPRDNRPMGRVRLHGNVQAFRCASCNVVLPLADV